MRRVVLDPCTRPQMAGCKATELKIALMLCSRIEFSTLTKHSQNVPLEMGVQKRVRKFTKVKRVIGQQDARLYVQDCWACNRIKLTLILTRKKNQAKGEAVAKRKAKGDEIVREMYFPKALFKKYAY